jgi:hypothetical protein
MSLLSNIDEIYDFLENGDIEGCNQILENNRKRKKKIVDTFDEECVDAKIGIVKKFINKMVDDDRMVNDIITCLMVKKDKLKKNRIKNTFMKKYSKCIDHYSYNFEEYDDILDDDENPVGKLTGDDSKKRYEFNVNIFFNNRNALYIKQSFSVQINSKKQFYGDTNTYGNGGIYYEYNIINRTININHEIENTIINIYEKDNLDHIISTISENIGIDDCQLFISYVKSFVHELLCIKYKKTEISDKLLKYIAPF